MSVNNNNNFFFATSDTQPIIGQRIALGSTTNCFEHHVIGDLPTKFTNSSRLVQKFSFPQIRVLFSYQCSRLYKVINKYFYNKKPLPSFMIGSRPLPIRSQTHKADVTVTQHKHSLTHSLACLFSFFVTNKSHTIFRYLHSNR